MRPVARMLAVLGCYAGLVVWLSWPLATRLSTELPGTRLMGSTFDPLYMGWVLAHESRALATAPSRLLDTNIYYPARRTLFYGDSGFGVLPYFLPTFLLTGNPTLALNLAFLGCVALTAWSLHEVARRWTGSHPSGFIAGASFLAAPFVLRGFVSTAPSYAVLQYLPPIVFLAATPAASFAGALRLLPLLVLQCLSDVVYIAPAVLAPLGLIALGRLARPATRAAGLRLLGVLVLAVLALAPVYVGHLMVRIENPHLLEQSIWSPHPLLTVLPWGPFTGPTGVPLAAWLLIALGAALFLFRPALRAGGVPRAWAHAGLWAFVGTVVFLEPTGWWHGRSFNLPQGWLADRVPLYDVIREPSRLRIPALIALALLAGLGFAACVGTLRARGRVVPACLALAVLGAMYTEHWRDLPPAELYPLTPAPTLDSSLLEALRRARGPLLELPIDDRAGVGGPVCHARAMYHSIFHQRPLLNGYDSYFPAGFRERMALARRLPDPDALATLQRETGLDTILLHTRELRPAERAAWMAPSRRDGLRMVGAYGGDLLFTVTEPPPLPGGRP